MSEEPLSKLQSDEQLLLDFGIGYSIQKLEQHNAHIPEGLVEKYMINHFLAKLTQVRRELCWIKDGAEFEMRVDCFRQIITAVDQLLAESKTVIVAHRQAEHMMPIWPEQLDWKD